MIVLTLKDDSVFKYNMPVEREKAFIAAWHAMNGDASFVTQKFKIKLDDGTTRLLQIGNIKHCQRLIDMVEAIDGSFEPVTEVPA